MKYSLKWLSMCWLWLLFIDSTRSRRALKIYCRFIEFQAFNWNQRTMHQKRKRNGRKKNIIINWLNVHTKLKVQKEKMHSMIGVWINKNQRMNLNQMQIIFETWSNKKWPQNGKRQETAGNELSSNESKEFSTMCGNRMISLTKCKLKWVERIVSSFLCVFFCFFN